MKNWFKNPLFIAVLVLKIACLFAFATKFPREYFIPFLDSAVKNIGSNPWSINHTELFPYGGVLFAILFVPKIIFYWIFGDLATGVHSLSLFALKMPLLFFDIVLFKTLESLSENRPKSLLYLVWMNPVIFFITYIHGQLDIVSMTFVCLSLLALNKKKTLQSAIFMGLATASKFHVVLAAPVILFFLWNNNFRKQALSQIISWSGISLGIAVLGFLPHFLASQVGQASTSAPEVQRLFALHFDLGSDLHLYPGIMLIMLVFGRLLISTRMTDIGLFFGVGSVFIVTVLASSPATGWYLWPMPFIALFFSLYLNVNRLLFWLFCFLFVLVYGGREFFNLESAIGNPWWSLLYSGLHTVLLANLIAIWQISLKKETPIVKRTRPLSIGIAGDSGSGKNTTANVLVKIFGESQTSMIEGDNYHRWERGDKNWETFTHLNPLANHLFSMSQHVKKILQGRAVVQPVYDHQTGRFGAPIEYRPTKNIIVQGLHSFFMRDVRDAFDLMIFMTPHPLVRTAWKVRRDCLERGYDKKKVLDQLKKREKDSENFIQSQKEFADLVIEHFPIGNFTPEQAESGDDVQLGIRFISWNDYDFLTLSKNLKQHGIDSEISMDSADPQRIVLVVQDLPSQSRIEKVSQELFSSLRHITRGYTPPQLVEGHMGLTQLIVLWMLAHRAQSYEGWS